MKTTLSVLLTCTLLIGAASLAFGETQKSENSANHAATNHRNRSTTHHKSSGSQHRSATNSGSKTHSNIPSN
jgi:hypothetical protein